MAVQDESDSSRRDKQYLLGSGVRLPGRYLKDSASPIKRQPVSGKVLTALKSNLRSDEAQLLEGGVQRKAFQLPAGYSYAARVATGPLLKDEFIWSLKAHRLGPVWTDFSLLETTSSNERDGWHVLGDRVQVETSDGSTRAMFIIDRINPDGTVVLISGQKRFVVRGDQIIDTSNGSTPGTSCRKFISVVGEKKL